MKWMIKGGILLPSHSPLPWNPCNTLPWSWHLSRGPSHMTLYSPLSISVPLHIVVWKLNSLSFTKLHIICTTQLLPSVSITFQLVPSVILHISTLLSHSVEPLAIWTLSSHLPLDSGITSLPLQRTQHLSLILSSTSIVNYKSSLVYIYIMSIIINN